MTGREKWTERDIKIIKRDFPRAAEKFTDVLVLCARVYGEKQVQYNNECNT